MPASATVPTTAASHAAGERDYQPYRILFEHYRHTYVVPGEKGPRAQLTRDPDARDAGATPTPSA